MNKKHKSLIEEPVTSTPGERIFSICGIVDTARRNRLNGKSIENQVFIHSNKHFI